MALSFVSPAVLEFPFDHVIVDEASVVRAPEAVLLKHLAGAPISFFGDPKQLPPIVIDRHRITRQWLGLHPFAMAEISEPSDATGACVMLEAQHRMAPPIRKLVSEFFYRNRLRDGDSAPKFGRVLVVDTSETTARSTSKMIRLSRSRENTVHRHVVADVIRALRAEDPELSVLVLAPFVAQKRAYRREPNTTSQVRDARFDTIHSAQGHEQDVVIIDLVIAGHGRHGRSRMLDEAVNEHLPNLLNVAMSRAKSQLVFVVHSESTMREYATKLTGRIIEAAGRAGTIVRVPADGKCRKAVEEALLRQ
jgi:superfamily I DNA and/or RNA helicase